MLDVIVDASNGVSRVEMSIYWEFPWVPWEWEWEWLDGNRRE